MTEAPVSQRVRTWLNRNIATIVAAAIGGVAVVAAAWIGAEAQRDRRAFERDHQQMEAKMLEQNNLIAQLRRQIASSSQTNTAGPIRQADTPTLEDSSPAAVTTDTSTREELPPQREPYSVKERSRFSFGLRACVISAESAACHFVITNKDDRPRPLSRNMEGTGYPCRAFANGRQVVVASAHIGGGRDAPRQLEMPVGVQVAAVLYFSDVPEDATRFESLQLRFQPGSEKWQEVTWPDVPLIR